MILSLLGDDVPIGGATMDNFHWWDSHVSGEKCVDVSLLGVDVTATSSFSMAQPYLAKCL